MFKTSNLKRFNGKLKTLAARMKSSPLGIAVETRRVLAIGGTKMHADIVRSMKNTPRGDKRYRRGKKHHVSSRPGNPPAIDTGNLVGSIRYDVEGMGLRIGAGINKPPYPKYLEKGTSRMAARPWLKPAVDRGTPGIIADLTRVIPDDVRRIFGGIS